MKQRCPHCQTTPLRADADTCWYCGKGYGARRKATRTTRSVERTVARRRAEAKAAFSPRG